VEPQIEYATTSDGVRLATMAFGEGPPLVTSSTPPWSHVQQETRIPRVRAFLEALSERARVVRYDCRGTGLSDREPLDFSIEAQVRDMEAVVDYHGLDRFAIYGSIGGGPASIVYTARHPERVSHLILWGAVVRGEFYTKYMSALITMLQENWDYFIDTFASLAFGWADSDTAEQYAQLTREAITHEAMLTLVRQLDGMDVTAEARAIQTPTLVMVRREVKFGLAEVSRDLAGLIPGARLLMLDGGAPAPFLGDVATVVEAFRAFMATAEPPRVPRPAAAALTDRETQVLRLLANGRTSKEIAAALSISVPTAQRHIANIYVKIGARGRVQAAAYAFQHGLSRPREA
jgi:pimeloyl-ACP methyl ester carboxylesterase/DNA-binding CsgD family transcriptional regulator